MYYFLIAGYYHENYGTHATGDECLDYRFIVDNETMNQLQSKHLLTNSQMKERFESTLSKRQAGIKRYLCPDVKNALLCCQEHMDKFAEFHDANTSIFLIETPDEVVLQNNNSKGINNFLIQGELENFTVRASFLQGYYNVGDKKYHKETLDKKVASFSEYLGDWRYDWRFIVILFSLPTLIVPAVFFLYVLWKQSEFKAILDNATAYLVKDALYLKNNLGEWQFNDTARAVNGLIQKPTPEFYPPVLTTETEMKKEIPSSLSELLRNKI